MADRTYRLCGFATGIDWKPVTFKESLPSVWVCDLCAYVSMKLAILHCGSVLCSACLNECITDDGRSICPLDKKTFSMDVDICWIPDPRGHFDKLQVSCWNSEHGCDFVGPLGKLLEHFEQRCDFHAASCPRCRDTMPRKDLPRHYSAGCIAVASPEANLQEPAAAQQSASRRLDLPVDCCHDVLASVQSRANELAEALRGLSTEFRQEVRSEWGVISASLRETVSAVTETSVELSRIETLLGTHCSSLRAAQSVHASAPVAAASLEGSTLVESRGGNTSAANEQHIVWTVLFPHSSNYHYRENCFACSQVALDGTCARLNLMCEHSDRTDFLIVYAESTRPNECVVVSVKPFTCDSQTSPSYWHKSRWQNSKPQGPPLTLRYMASLSSHRPTVIGDINKFDFIISVNQCAH